jgi:hypothetical protein
MNIVFGLLFSLFVVSNEKQQPNIKNQYSNVKQKKAHVCEGATGDLSGLNTNSSFQHSQRNFEFWRIHFVQDSMPTKKPPVRQ